MNNHDRPVIRSFTRPVSILCMLSNFACCLSSEDVVIKYFRNTVSASNGLDVDQDQRSLSA